MDTDGNNSQLINELSQPLNTTETIIIRDAIDSSTPRTPAADAPGIFIVIMLIICGWIVLSNTSLVMILVTNRKKTTNVVNIQLVTLSVTDALIGISAIPLTFSYYLMETFQYSVTCKLMYSCWMTSQTAGMFHMCSICVQRIVAFHRRSPPGHSSYKTLSLQVILPWLLAIIETFVIVQVYASQKSILRKCSPHTMFGDNYITAASIIMGTFFVTQISITVAYAYLYVGIVSREKQRSTDIVESTWRRTDSPQQSENFSNQRSDVFASTSATLTVHAERRSALAVVSGMGNGSIEIAQSSTMNTDKSCNSGKENAAVNRKDRLCASHTRHRSVLVTIGMLLIVLTVCITPFNCIPLIEILKGGLMDRKVKFLLGVLCLMNAALNPLIYATRVPPLRRSIQAAYKRLRQCFRIHRVHVQQRQ